MSAKDKTGDQIAETIRKAKAASAPVKKRIVAKKPATATTKSTPEKKPVSVVESNNPFRQGCRVWPD